MDCSVRMRNFNEKYFGISIEISSKAKIRTENRCMHFSELKIDTDQNSNQ